MYNSKLLSICIPTRGRAEILLHTVKSIYESKVDLSTFEVIIYDSSGNNELQINLNRNFPHNNLIYKVGNNDGFMNLIHALNLGSGTFLKLHNDYSLFSIGSLERLLIVINENRQRKPSIFFSNGNISQHAGKQFLSFNDFLYTASYYTSWSTAFGIWNSDFANLKGISLSPMFPHTNLLFALSDIKKDFIINNYLLFTNQIISKKGGYDFFKTFSIDYLQLVEQCLIENKITKDTFLHIKKDLFKNFLMIWYRKTVLEKNDYTYSLVGIKKSLKFYYSNSAYYYMISVTKFQYYNELIIEIMMNKLKSIKYLKKIKNQILFYFFKKVKKLIRIYHFIEWNIEKNNFKSFGNNGFIYQNRHIKNPQYISIGDNFSALQRLRIEAWDSYGDQQFKPEILIGNNVKFNTDIHIGCIERVQIGDNCLFASRIFITDHDHGDTSIRDLNISPVNRPLVSKGPVVIKENVWIGEGVSILSGVTIGENSIVAANAVVTKNVPANCVVGGNPAKIIKTVY